MKSGKFRFQSPDPAFSCPLAQKLYAFSRVFGGKGQVFNLHWSKAARTHAKPGLFSMRDPVRCCRQFAHNYLLLEHNVDRGVLYGVVPRFESLIQFAALRRPEKKSAL